MNLSGNALFNQMTEEDIRHILGCMEIKEKRIKKNEYIFKEDDTPNYMYLLKEGKVVVCKDFLTGNRMIINTFEEPGSTFGEVYLFLNDKNYDSYVIAMEDTVIYEIPKRFFFHTCQKGCAYHEALIRNMLTILSEKAYALSKKLQIMSAGSLRLKLCKYLVQNCDDKGRVLLKYTREELADYLSVARPSLSREMMRMQEEGLIVVKGKKIFIIDKEGIEELL